ncbi:MAG TPA: hypothetical protein VK197_02725, partial [Verrucomicrobiae bacterium]|nr:hypothetical protein [Verrucomicrobiae bacterium]
MTEEKGPDANDPEKTEPIDPASQPRDWSKWEGSDAERAARDTQRAAHEHAREAERMIRDAARMGHEHE